MAWNYEVEKTQDGLQNIYAWENDDKKKRRLVYTIDKGNRLVTFFPKGDFPVNRVRLEGFTGLPSEFGPAGYIKGGLEYYINKKLEGFDVTSLTISKNGSDHFRKLPKKKSHSFVLSYKSFSKLKDALTNINSEAKFERSSYVDEFFHTTYPSKYGKIVKASAKGRARRVVKNVDNEIISELSSTDVEKLVDFFTQLISKRYTSSKSRLELLKATKVRVDKVALDDVIKRFEELLNNNSSESIWGEFLKENLFLIESKYVAVIPELNVMLASQRKVDFGLVDTHGYLDIFEIKKSSTNLLAKNQDRGNYYWHSDMTKAIAQAEKYLFQAVRKASPLTEDIKRERKIDVKVIKPKAFIIAGETSQLKNHAMRDDFRVLRDSLKNIEVILYDELLIRLQNQLTKIYTDPEIKLKKSIGK